MKKFFILMLLMISTLVLSSCGSISIVEEGGSESLEVNQSASEEKMEELANNDGYSIKFEYVSTDSDSDEEERGSYYYGYKGNIQWFISDDSGIAIKVEDDKAYVYDYYDGEYTFSNMYDDEDMVNALSQSFINTYNYWLYFTNTYDGSLSKGADTTVCGRGCYTYTFDMSNLSNMMGGIIAGIAGVSLKYKVAVDKEYGITLKLEFVGTADGDTETFSYEVKEFKTGSSVSVPRLPEPVLNED